MIAGIQFDDKTRSGLPITLHVGVGVWGGLAVVGIDSCTVVVGGGGGVVHVVVLAAAFVVLVVIDSHDGSDAVVLLW